MKIARTGLYSFTHFAVDFTCAFYVYSFVGGGNALLSVLLYNFCAFALQMPLGIILDRLERDKYFAAAGTLLTACGVFLGGAPTAFPIVIGLGNALFHIGAGRGVLCESDGKLTSLGIFVSPGAIGLYFGALLGGKASLSLHITAIALTALAACIILIPEASEAANAPASMPVDIERRTKQKGGSLALSILALFLVVIIRSFAGMNFSFPWKAEGSYALWAVLALALGKAAGGILADKIGLTRISLISLCLSGILFIWGGYPAAGLLAIFMFNMTMPVTLGALARLKPESLGFGFGLLTFALFLGAIPNLLRLPINLPLPWAAVIASLVSCVLLVFGVRKADGY